MQRLILALILSTGAAGAAALAQPPGPPPGGPRWQRPDPAAIIAQQKSDITLLLGLRADQQPALDAMLRTTTPPRPPRRPGPDGAGAPPAPPSTSASFTDHLAEMEKAMNSRGDAERGRIAALRTFYQGLDNVQKQRFGALMRMSHGPGPGMRLHVPGRPGGPGGPGERDPGGSPPPP